MRSWLYESLIACFYKVGFDWGAQVKMEKAQRPSLWLELTWDHPSYVPGTGDNEKVRTLDKNLNS